MSLCRWIARERRWDGMLAGRRYTTMLYVPLVSHYNILKGKREIAVEESYP